MKEGPDIARIGTLIGDPARANMLTALMGGHALTASELASAAGVSLPTASAHLGKLEDGGLISQRKQGRHRYFALSGETAALLESIMGFAANHGHLRHRPGPKDPALRQARICYDHLAGDFGVRMLDSLVERGAVRVDGEMLELTSPGRQYICDIGIDIEALHSPRRPLCKACLDWSERRSHLAGTLGKALLQHFLAEGWARRDDDSRAIRFSRSGLSRFVALFPVRDAEAA